MAQRLARVREVVEEQGPITAYDIVPQLYGEPITKLNAGWWLPETLCHLRHLKVTGMLERVVVEAGAGGEPERWRASAGA